MGIDLIKFKRPPRERAWGPFARPVAVSQVFRSPSGCRAHVVDMLSNARRLPRSLTRFAIGALAAVGVISYLGPVAAAAIPEPVHLVDRAITAPAPSVSMLVNVHNAGDTSSSAARAVAAHPSMLELDVSWDGEHLVVAHTLLPRPFRQDATDLVTAWSRANGVGAVLIDSKTYSRAGTTHLVTFMRAHPNRSLYVSSPDAQVLDRIHAGDPRVHGLLSLNNSAEVDQLTDGDSSVPGLIGVSVADHLLSQPVVADLRRQGLFVLAYSVNDMSRVDTLASWGVRGITTDNLAVVRALMTSHNGTGTVANATATGRGI